jgi:N-acetylglucosamine-6-phosphate deacetylase
MGEWVGRHALTGEVVRIRAGDGRIASIDAVSTNDEVPWILPGLIDLQVNGIADLDLNRGTPSPETVSGAARALLADGVTGFLPTVGTAPEAHIVDAVRAIADACDSDPVVGRTVAGIHVEGPFISPEDGPRGVHDPAAVRPPDFEEVMRWQEAARGRIRVVTLAPELPGAVELVRRLVAHGIVAAIGHSAATEQDVRAAAEAGATMSTHLGNGTATMVRRHPNHLWAQLADDRLWAGLIGDGFHLPASTLTAMIRAKGQRAVLVSDVGSLAGMPPGRYSGRHHTDVVLEVDGRLHIADQPELLAGSASTLRDGLSFVVRSGILPLAGAVPLATRNPARAIGLQGVGELVVGASANLAVMRWRGEQADGIGRRTVLEPVEVVLDGETVTQAS